MLLEPKESEWVSVICARNLSKFAEGPRLEPNDHMSCSRLLFDIRDWNINLLSVLFLPRGNSLWMSAYENHSLTWGSFPFGQSGGAALLASCLELECTEVCEQRDQDGLQEPRWLLGWMLENREVSFCFCFNLLLIALGALEKYYTHWHLSQWQVTSSNAFNLAFQTLLWPLSQIPCGV